MLYEFLKVIIRLALKVFFRNIRVKWDGEIPKKGPLIVVANHPNTFMDPLIIASILRPQVYFLANSSIFSSPFTRWLFKNLHMIPIQRKIDKPNQKVDNKEIFQKCYDFLARGGTLLIFPEGTSVRERRLRKLKTGTARIALGAEAQHNFDIHIKILTVGLNYSKPESFRSEVFVNIDEPIHLKDYQESYQKDSFEAARDLTEDIRQKLEDHIIVTHNDREDTLAKLIEQVYKSKLSHDLPLADEAKEQSYLISKGIVDAVHHFEEQDPERLEAFQPKIDRYLRNLDRLKLNDEIFATSKSKSRGLFWESLQTAIYFILGFPLFLYGLINNYIPYIIPSQVAAKIVHWTKVEEYTAPIMFATGILTFPFFYFLQGGLFHWLSGSFYGALLYLLSLPLSGFFALFYANYLHTTRDKWRLLGLFFKRNDLVSSLLSDRKEIIQDLEKAKKDYLSYYETE